MEKFFIISLFVGLGAVFKRFKSFPEQTPQVLNMVALYAALPAVILLKIPTLHFSREMVIPATIPWLMLIISVLLVLWGEKVFRWSKEASAVLLLVVPIGNTAFMGVPMVTAFFGEAGIPHLIVYDQLGTMLIFAVYGSVVLSIYSNRSKLKFRQIVIKSILFPPTLALIVGLAMHSRQYPELIAVLLNNLSGILTPLVMIAIGFQLKIRLSPGVICPLLFGLAVKLIVAPGVALIGCNLVGITGLSVKVSIFEAGMPPMVTSGALAIAVGLLPELAAATVSTGMVLSFFTLPLLFLIL
ncbi:AEC family transporter [Maridesulfovibrio sp.]|uniref:AEC family transporter n=1 Tax=Maridesulfovibrio sp. TaxID=2795000 RepID=UPI002A187E22|nr:AEC family transporter [Maridesulfovibrio sp.]